MAVLKCKMCGGDLNIPADEKIIECEFCGTTQTIPEVSDEKKTNLFNRANRLRIANEFDKAAGIYESIIAEFPDEAESYWGLCLCKFGIEYVDDPKTAKKIPTCHRTSFESIFDDENYKMATTKSDIIAQGVYKEEATVIDNLQKDILSIVHKEEPFDVFICYKETDELGQRTQDSVLAQDIYDALTDKGFKVFFSRITLEDKLGKQYEPYIFAALNSAKVMLAIGTKEEYYNAVWVKNEWSRYLALMETDKRKMLIPCYRDIDPYDMPQEFKNLQGQDMSKLGFMQDLVRGIKKIVSVDTSTGTKETVIVQNAVSGNASALVKRGFLALEDEEWEKADEFFEQALNQNAEDAQAYLGKLMAELKVNKKEKLVECNDSFEYMSNYQKVIRFGSEKIKNELQGYIEFINERNEEERLKTAYTNAVNQMNTATTEKQFEDASVIFDSIKSYKDAEQLAEECRKKAENVWREKILKNANSLLDDSHHWVGKENDFSSYIEAVNQLETIRGYKDSDEKRIACQRIADEITARLQEERRKKDLEEEQKRIEKEKQEQAEREEKARIAKRNKKMAIIATPIICIVVALTILLNNIIIPAFKRYKAIEKYGEEFVVEFEKLKVGDTYIFGSFEQDDNLSNGDEEIEWLVLDKQKRKALVISKYALDCRQYHWIYEPVAWETCSLRNWLNSDFVNSSFSAEEKELIPTVTVVDYTNSEYVTNAGNTTQDKVFLLSIDEVNTYFKSDYERQCKPTKYAEWAGVYTEGNNGRCWYWWLRSPGENQSSAAYVRLGVVDKRGGFVYDNIAVRPAMWIDLD